jgi:hypothetical protein
VATPELRLLSREVSVAEELVSMRRYLLSTNILRNVVMTSTLRVRQVPVLCTEFQELKAFIVWE